MSVCTLLLHAPGLVSCVRQHASCQSSSKAAMAARGGRIIFFIFLECCGMNSFFLVTQSFSPHRSLVNFKIHFPIKQSSRSTRHFIWHFLRLKGSCWYWVQLHNFSIPFKILFLCAPATRPLTTNLWCIYFRNQCFKLTWRQVLQGMHVTSYVHIDNPTVWLTDSETRITDWVGSVMGKMQRPQWFLYWIQLNNRQEHR